MYDEMLSFLWSKFGGVGLFRIVQHMKMGDFLGFILQYRYYRIFPQI